MSRYRLSTVLALFTAFCMFSAPAAAQCQDLKQFIKEETAGAEKYVDIFSFRHDHRADSVLMLVKDTTEKGHLPKRWLFLHRDNANSEDLCLHGRGEEFGQHDDLHENGSANNFGPPGSGFPLCVTSTAQLQASEALRDWANRELGHSIILYTASKETSGFQFVIADDRDWIIGEDRNDQQQSCYFDRGTDVLMRFNITVIKP